MTGKLPDTSRNAKYNYLASTLKHISELKFFRKAQLLRRMTGGFRNSFDVCDHSGPTILGVLSDWNDQEQEHQPDEKDIDDLDSEIQMKRLGIGKKRSEIWMRRTSGMELMRRTRRMIISSFSKHLNFCPESLADSDTHSIFVATAVPLLPILSVIGVIRDERMNLMKKRLEISGEFK